MTQRLRNLLCAWALAIGLGMLLSPIAASAQINGPRLALVIGNSDYEFVGRLGNPTNDARLIRETLEGLGFEVIYRENIGRDDMQRAIGVFGERLYQAGPDASGLFYYAGHAVQSNGENFLLPVDIEIERESDLRFNAVRTSDLMAQMDGSGASTKIIILDACRTSPFLEAFGRTTAGQGLAAIGLGNSEFFVAYAATSGNVAEDGTGKNSPYAEALARRMPTMNSDIANTFRLVRVDVSSATNQTQLPEDRSTLRRDFFFAGGRTGPDPAPAPQPNSPQLAALELKPEDLVGDWCTPGRGADFQLTITASSLIYTVGRQRSVYDVTDLDLTEDGRVRLVWKNRDGEVVFEFGDFSPSGSMMTQIRGLTDAEGGWQTYNRRFRKCG